jgi:hypothetical protein
LRRTLGTPLIGATVLTMMGLSLAACGGGARYTTVIIPPRVDLASFERIGLVLFTVENADDGLSEYATQRFAERLLNAQWGYELLELGAYEVGIDGPERTDLARALGEEFGLEAVFLGHIEVSEVRPRATLSGGARISADATMSLTVRMLSGPSGGTLWTRSSRIRDTLAEVSLVGGSVHFGADDPAEVYGTLVNRLLTGMTRDFRPTRERRRIR